MLLKEYLLNVLQLEMSLESQKQAISDAEYSIEHSWPDYPSKPKAPALLSAPERKEGKIVKPEVPAKGNYSSLVYQIPLTLAVCAFAGWMVKLVLDLFSTFGQGEWNIFYVFILFIGLFGSFALALFLISSTYATITLPTALKRQYPVKLKAYEEEQAEIEKEYQDALSRYEKAKAKIDSEYARELKKYDAAFDEIYEANSANKKTAQKAIDQMLDEKLSTLKILNQYYDADVVHPKYRNIPALTAICEYLDTGRCSALTGPGGAYNIYESEKRQDQILNKLDNVISKLEKIEKNQVLMIRELQHIKHNSDSMVHDMKDLLKCNKEIKTFTAITAYCSAVTAVNTAATAYYTSNIAKNTEELKYIALAK